jgi:hypothetical protein
VRVAIAATIAAVFASLAPVVSSVKDRQVTMTGCVQATGEPGLFLLTVPAELPEAVRGIAKGEPVPSNAGIGPAPRPDPLTVPPLGTNADPGLPEGRYSTPTMRNRSYELLNVKAARMKTLVGKAVEVVGRIPVEGYPTGDEPSSPGKARALASVLNPPFKVNHMKIVADSCAALIRSK